MSPAVADLEKQPAGQGQRRLLDEIRERFPGLAKRADRGIQAAAIRLFCIHCLGGDRGEVERCTAPWCPLYEFRLTGQWCRKPPRAAEPSAKQLQSLERAREKRLQNAPDANSRSSAAPNPENAESAAAPAATEPGADPQPSGEVRR